MIDRQKVLNGLECCSQLTGNGCRRCPYDEECVIAARLCSDALELLKEDEQTIESLQSTINKLTKSIAE